MRCFLLLLLSIIAIRVQAQTLREALSAKDTVLALRLLKDGVNPDEKDRQGATLLQSSCHFPDLATASFLLRHGVKPDAARSPKGRTALMVVCAYWCGMDMVKLLVNFGADVNLSANDGSTPLMLAAMNEKQDVVDFLLAKGADAKAKDKNGQTALDYARKGKVEDYMVNGVKDTRFSREAVIASLEAAMK